MKPKSIATIHDISSVVYQVQTTYPDNEKREPKDAFKGYAAHAFITLKTAKALEKKKQVAQDKDMAIFTDPAIFIDSTTGDKVNSTMNFTNPEDAFRVAAFIRDKCRIMSGWSHGTLWEKRYRGKIRTRVVMMSSRTTVHHIVESD
jgi:CRISPR/Cas system Type II protein with McrA/HNH and RuvC-like nuclease domain